MVHAVIEKNCYQDSITLMILTNKLNELPGVEGASVMMGTPANRNILKDSGFHCTEIDGAMPSDMVVAVKSNEGGIMESVLSEIKAFLSGGQTAGKNNGAAEVNSWRAAEEKGRNANLALLSIPGEYVYEQADMALDKGKNVFIFSDNVSIQDEIRLKEKARGKGLLVMGPDCGTGIISGVPIAFANNVRAGHIGIAGASGTGIQEVSVLIDRYGGGISHAIGTGGRDLKLEIGGLSMEDAIRALNDDESTETIVVISKPPQEAIKLKITGLLQTLEKPSVVVFIGDFVSGPVGNIYYAATLDEAAQAAVFISKHGSFEHFHPDNSIQSPALAAAGTDWKICGLYTGGTLSGEAAMLISKALGLKNQKTQRGGYVLQEDGHEIIDLGDDIYTKGTPHPMMNPEKRTPFIQNIANSQNNCIVLLDVVLGYGAHENVAAVIGPSIKEALEKSRTEGRKLVFIASICGTDKDIQNRKEQALILKQVGAIVEESNNKAVRHALSLMGYGEPQPLPPDGTVPSAKPVKKRAVPQGIKEMLQQKPFVLNMGVKGFVQAVEENGGKALHFNFRPSTASPEAKKALKDLGKHENYINEKNLEVINRIIEAQPVLVDVVPAKSAIRELNGKTLLHAGPPIQWENMTSPMQGSCIGAVLFEGWAEDEKSALKLLESGGVRLMPCHHVNAVGPMGGITSANMPVLVVKDKKHGNTAFCSLNEGIGAVLRFGAYSQVVIKRLHWMRETLGPVLSEALKKFPDGLNLNVLIAKAITMGDEFHQRNIAASLLFLKELAPAITVLHRPESEKEQVIKFLADTDQFFLNIMMAASKAVMDGARHDACGTVVTAMCRNGENFGIRLSGMGDEWFTAPCNRPDGLYFSGYSSSDASADLGDSAITETFGVGGMAMIAAPAVTRFVGSGGFQDALDTSNEMMDICIGSNPNFTVPTWDFQGICLGIDARKVVDTEILPVINTGIAHKKAGVGQIGAGTVKPPLACFEKALIAYEKKMASL